jgi:hypothetical protein
MNLRSTPSRLQKASATQHNDENVAVNAEDAKYDAAAAKASSRGRRTPTGRQTPTKRRASPSPAEAVIDVTPADVQFPSVDVIIGQTVTVCNPSATEPKDEEKRDDGVCVFGVSRSSTVELDVTPSPAKGRVGRSAARTKSPHTTPTTRRTRSSSRSSAVTPVEDVPPVPAAEAVEEPVAEAVAEAKAEEVTPVLEEQKSTEKEEEIPAVETAPSTDVTSVDVSEDSILSALKQKEDSLPSLPAHVESSPTPVSAVTPKKKSSSSSSDGLSFPLLVLRILYVLAVLVFVYYSFLIPHWYPSA